MRNGKGLGFYRLRLSRLWNARLRNRLGYRDRYDAGGNTLLKNQSRVSPAFRGGDSHRGDSRGTIPVNARYLGMAVYIRVNYRRMRAVRERSDRIAIGQPEGNRRSGSGLRGAIHDFHREFVSGTVKHPQLQRGFRLQRAPAEAARESVKRQSAESGQWTVKKKGISCGLMRLGRGEFRRVESKQPLRCPARPRASRLPQGSGIFRAEFSQNEAYPLKFFR